MNTTLKKIIIALTFSFSSFGLFFITAQTKPDDLKVQIQNNQSEIQKLEKEILEYNSKINDKKSDAATLKSAIKGLESRKAILEKDIKLANYKIENKKYSITEIEGKIDVTENKLSTLENGLKDTFRELIHLGNLREDTIFVYLGSQTISEAFDNYNRSFKLKDNIEEGIMYYNDTKKNLENINRGYKTEVTKLQELESELKDKKITVAETQKEKDLLLKDTKAQELAYQKILNDRKKQKIALEKEILDYESKLKALVDTNKLPKSGTGVLSYPLRKVTITQYFGNTPFSTQNPQVYNGSGHNGVDFGVPVGTALYSAGDGKIMATGDTDIACRGASYGKWVLIKHNNGLTTLYAHLSSINVSEGQSVASGEKIGLSGNTGYSTGPHLHFTVFASDSVTISDPASYRSKTCGVYMKLPLAPRGAYLNPLTYL